MTTRTYLVSLLTPVATDGPTPTCQGHRHSDLASALCDAARRSAPTTLDVYQGDDLVARAIWYPRAERYELLSEFVEDRALTEGLRALQRPTELRRMAGLDQ